MSEAAHLLGIWVGSGEALVQGTLRSFTQTETVTPHLDGELLTIEGVGHDPDDATRRTHLAFAVLSYDVEQQRYQWRAYSAGHWADTELRLTPQGFSWTLATRPGLVTRYTASIDGDLWEEVGQKSQNSAPWSTIMTMRLHRQPPHRTLPQHPQKNRAP